MNKTISRQTTMRTVMQQKQKQKVKEQSVEQPHRHAIHAGMRCARSTITPVT